MLKHNHTFMVTKPITIEYVQAQRAGLEVNTIIENRMSWRNSQSME